MKNKKLYIIAAGMSSRIGGYPKHLCEIDNAGTTNLEHTLSLAKTYYNDIVVVINKLLKNDYVCQTYEIANKYNAKVKLIESGKGDAHAIYEAIKKEIDYECVTCIWGDTFFSENLFKIDVTTDTLTVVCAKEISPYCYITLNENNKISGIYLKSESPIGDNEKYLHDQSMFVINVNKFIKYFCDYKNYYDYISQLYIKTNIEYSTIKLINWCVKSKNENIDLFILPERTNPYSMSFNTKEDLHNILNFNKKNEKSCSN